MTKYHNPKTGKTCKTKAEAIKPVVKAPKKD